VLANPGHGLEKMQASAAMYLGMQLLLPGEWAPAHRHTPNAQCPMPCAWWWKVKAPTYGDR
jgi:gentisate 1,2-dioxygenase